MNTRITLGFHIFNKQDTIESVLRSWLDTASGLYPLEVILVYDDLADQSDQVCRAVMADYPGVEVIEIYTTAAWEIGANNAMIERASGEFIIFIQDDNWMYEQGWDCYVWAISVAIRQLPADQTVGAIGLLAGVIIQGDLSYQRIECRRPHKQMFHNLDDAPGVYAVDFTTRPLAVRTSLARSCGGFEQAYYPMDWDESDFCLKLLRAGHCNVYAPFDLLNTVGKRETIGERTMSANFQRGRRIFAERHQAWLRERGPSEAKLLWEVDW